jgi:sucrose-6-phosphate hydrolase SacC (GH32 family)
MDKIRPATWATLLAALAAANCGGVNAAADSTRPAGDIAHWAFDEQRGSGARESVSGRADKVDFVFNQARFKPSSDPLWRAAPACIRGGCLLFDGYSTSLTVPALRTAQLQNGWTLSAWVAPHAFEWGDGGNYSAFLSQFDEQAKQGFSFGMYRFGTWGIRLGFGNSIVDVRVRSAKLPRDTWSFVAASYDPAARQVHLFLNGEQVANAAAPDSGTFALPQRPLVIGSHSQAIMLEGLFRLNSFLGLMDEVRISPGSANVDSLKRIMAAELSAHGGKVPALTMRDVTVAREAFDGDRHRPQFHAIPNSGWMNEPHAPFYYKGSYHLFFQKNPFGPFWHQIHWGHWVSPDLVHWRELPMALAPEDGELAPDGIWSGSASYAADGTPALFFTAGNDSAAIRERTGLAVPKDSNDPDLVTWKEHPAPVTLPEPGAISGGNFRDPFVFRDAQRGSWFQLVGSVLPGGSGSALVYESQDLKNWHYRGPLFSIDPAKYPAFVRTFELPVLLPIGMGSDGRQRHVFLTDVRAQAYYWIGVFDPATARFTPEGEAPRVFDLGEGHFSGPSGMVDPKTGRSIVFSIAQGERSLQDDWASGWAHNAGLPVAMSLGADGDLQLSPIEEINTLRSSQLLDLHDTTPAAANKALAAVSGDMLDIELELAPSPASTAKRGLVLRRTPDDAERTALYLDAASKRFEIDRQHTTLDASALSRGVQGGAFDLRGENVKLRVLLDRSMVESYLNGRKSLTSRVFPTRADATGLALLADTADRVVSLKVWRMLTLTGQPAAPAR